MDKKIHHPNEDCLRSFALGKLDEATSLFIRLHLDGCNQCAQSMESSVAALNPVLAQEPARKTPLGEQQPYWGMIGRDEQKGAAKRPVSSPSSGSPPHPQPPSSTTTAALPDTIPFLAPFSGSASAFVLPSRPVDKEKSASEIPRGDEKNAELLSPQVPDWASQIPLAKDGSSVSLQALSPALIEQKQYQIVRRLGEGSMGTVYLAKNILFDREEAIKVIAAERIASLGDPQTFLADMDAASRLNHPHIVASHGAMQWDNQLVFCMEYVAGESLAAYAERYIKEKKEKKEKGPFPIANACYYGYQTALGLQHAHEHGMVHQDIRPSNLMLFRNAHRHIVKILDFGLGQLGREFALNPSPPLADGRAVKSGEAANLQKTAAFPGTLHYLAPERARNGVSAGIQSDIYSLGCTLYHLLCGHPPFEGESAREILDKHAGAEAPRIDDLRPEVPYQVGSIIRRMMAKDPAKRYETPAEVARALTPFFKPDPPSKKMDAVDPGSSHEEPYCGPAPASSGSQAGHASKARNRAAMRRSAQRGRLQAIALGGGLVGLVLAVGMALPRFGVWTAVSTEPKLGIVAIEGIPPGAVLHLDGVMVSAERKDGKVELPMDAGKDHLLEIKKEGFETWSRRIFVDEGTRKSFKAQLPVSSPAPERPKGGPTGKGSNKKDFISQSQHPTTVFSPVWPWKGLFLFTGPSGSGPVLKSQPEADPRQGGGAMTVDIPIERVGPLP